MIHALIAFGFIAVIVIPCFIASRVDLNAEDDNVPPEGNHADSIFQ